MVQRYLLQVVVVVDEVFNILDELSVYEVLATRVDDGLRNTGGAHEHLKFFFGRAEILQEHNV